MNSYSMVLLAEVTVQWSWVQGWLRHVMNYMRQSLYDSELQSLSSL